MFRNLPDATGHRQPTVLFVCVVCVVVALAWLFRGAIVTSLTG